jgi:hypothetical protein
LGCRGGDLLERKEKEEEEKGKERLESYKPPWLRGEGVVTRLKPFTT